MKVGLVLEGGASRAAFTCGVLDLLLDKEIYIDYVIGASAGVSYGVSYSNRQRGRNYEIFEKYVGDPRYMGIKHLLGKKRSYYNMDFVFTDIPCTLLPYNWEDYEKYGCTSYAVLTNIETGKTEYMQIKEFDPDWNILRGTCALPILFPPAEIDGSLYMDGGITDSLPIEHALSEGCEKLVVVLTRERDYVKKKESLTPLVKVLYRRYPKVAQALSRRHIVYNEQRARLWELEKQGKALVIAPESTHKIKRTEKRASVLLPFYHEGYNAAEQRVKEIEEFLR